MKVGFIGSGNISRFHIDALLNNRFHIGAIGTRVNSLRCKELAQDFKILDKYCINGWEEVLTKKVDAFCLCIDIAKTPEILFAILELGKPVLVEKPVSWDLDNMDNLFSHPNKDRIFVAYNRRYYKTLNTLKVKCDECESGGTISVNIPDPIEGIKQFLSNGCHMIDSLRYIAGDFQIKSKLKRFNKKGSDISSISALCENTKWNILVNAHSLIPSNFSITINIEDLVYELKPLEKLTIYKGMEIIQPTVEEPIRRYIPEKQSSMIESSKYKPGFDQMYKSFFDFIINKKDNKFCNIADANKTLKVCWDLIGIDQKSKIYI